MMEDRKSRQAPDTALATPDTFARARGTGALSGNKARSAGAAKAAKAMKAAKATKAAHVATLSAGRIITLEQCASSSERPDPTMPPHGRAYTDISVAEKLGVNDVRKATTPGTEARRLRQPDVIDHIHAQCRCFIQDFSAPAEAIAARPRVIDEEAEFHDLFYAGAPDYGTTRPMSRTSMALRRILHNMIAEDAPESALQTEGLKAFCNLLARLASCDADQIIESVGVYCHADTAEAVRAKAFARQYFPRLRVLREKAFPASGDCIYLLLGALAGNRLAGIWNRQNLESIPIFYLALMNAMASAAVPPRVCSKEGEVPA